MRYAQAPEQESAAEAVVTDTRIAAAPPGAADDEALWWWYERPRRPSRQQRSCPAGALFKTLDRRLGKSSADIRIQCCARVDYSS